MKEKIMGNNTSKYRDYDRELWRMVGASPHRPDMMEVYRRLLAQQKAIREAETSPLARFRGD